VNPSPGRLGAEVAAARASSGHRCWSGGSRGSGAGCGRKPLIAGGPRVAGRPVHGFAGARWNGSLCRSGRMVPERRPCSIGPMRGGTGGRGIRRAPWGDRPGHRIHPSSRECPPPPAHPLDRHPDRLRDLHVQCAIRASQHDPRPLGHPPVPTAGMPKKVGTLTFRKNNLYRGRSTTRHTSYYINLCLRLRARDTTGSARGAPIRSRRGRWRRRRGCRSRRCRGCGAHSV
jgi:hypothetical protein